MSRARTSMLANDNGDVFFSPSTAWTNEDEELFQKDCKIDDVSVAMVKKVTLNPMLTFSNQTRGLPVTAATSAPTTAATHAIPSTANKSLASVTTAGATSKMSAKLKSVTTVDNKSKTSSAATKTKKVKMDLAGGSTISKLMTSVAEGAEEMHKTVHDLFSSSAEPDATIRVNVLKSTVLIKDYEFNSFAMDLAFARVAHDEIPVEEEQGSGEEKVVDVFNKKRETPMDVVVLLAGEVPGLKPPAVARYPKPPKLFIINRHGEATEVVSLNMCLRCEFIHLIDCFDNPIVECARC